MYLIFDVETADAPPKSKVRKLADERDWSIWPRLVQLGFVLYNKHREPIIEYDKIMKPDGRFIIQEGARNVHKISTEMAEEQGISAEEIFRDFYDAMNQAQYVVCHNLDFDNNVMLAEHYKNQIKSKPNSNERIKFCTMKSTTDICRIPHPNSWEPDQLKWPTLSELHQFLFGYTFADAHNAMIDVKATAQCFWELIDRNYILSDDPSILRCQFN